MSEEFESFLRHNGIEHRRMTPLWPQANGKVERQNRSLLKSLQIANLEGKNWRIELVTWLAAYRSTPQATTDATPYFLMFGREMRSKLPELRRETVQVPLEEVRDRDWSSKLKGKFYADSRRGATPKSIRVRDTVLLKAEKSNKLSTNFRPNPFKVVEKTGSEVTVRSDAGVEFKHNTAFIKKYNNPGGVPREVVDGRKKDVQQTVSGLSASSPVVPEPALPESSLKKEEVQVDIREPAPFQEGSILLFACK